MKILFYRYGSICEPGIINAFKILNQIVDEEQTEITNKEIGDKERINLLRQKLMGNQYDIVFSINFYPIISEVCNVFKMPYVCWTVDSPVLELYSHSIQNECNRIFMFDRAQYQEFSIYNPKRIFYLPLATEVRNSVKKISEKENEKYSCDISFVGSLYTEKCDYNNAVNIPDYLRGYLEGIMATQEKVYGYNFLDEVLTQDIVDDFKKCIDFIKLPEKYFSNEIALMAQHYLSVKVTEQERIHLLDMISKRYSVDIYTLSDTKLLPDIHSKGAANTLVEMPMIFYLSKININLTAKSIRTGIPLRVWDILGAEGFLLTNFQEELPEYFEIGKDLDIFESSEDLCKKIKFYLENEEKRNEIAKNGMEKVHKYHSYEKRVQHMLETISKL